VGVDIQVFSSRCRTRSEQMFFHQVVSVSAATKPGARSRQCIPNPFSSLITCTATFRKNCRGRSGQFRTDCRQVRAGLPCRKAPSPWVLKSYPKASGKSSSGSLQKGSPSLTGESAERQHTPRARHRCKRVGRLGRYRSRRTLSRPSEGTGRHDQSNFGELADAGQP
jgi:hypothetical protein